MMSFIAPRTRTQMTGGALPNTMMCTELACPYFSLAGSLKESFDVFFLRWMERYLSPLRDGPTAVASNLSSAERWSHNKNEPGERQERDLVFQT